MKHTKGRSRRRIVKSGRRPIKRCRYRGSAPVHHTARVNTEGAGCCGGILGLYYLFAVVYTFIHWGFWWSVLNVFIPFAPIYDLIIKLGKI